MAKSPPILRRYAYFQWCRFAHGALVDLTASAHACVAREHERGQSRWSSLQATEKMLKFFLEQRSQAFPKVHKLAKLATRCESVGLPKIEPRILTQYSATPGCATKTAIIDCKMS